ncbi:MAG: CYTH domain-containing protein [Bacteroidales bacterium]|nr:CYTH domain-containing protein [Bacteroidales bacterium]
MGKEIERKFLVKSDIYKTLATGTYYRQGYVPTLNGMTVRLRIAGEKGFITMKDHAIGFTRHEFEYEIPKEDATQMLELMCSKPQIEKHRYVIPASSNSELASSQLFWEVDEFLGDNAGLVVAEIEVPSEDTTFEIPDWVGEEVTGDKRYYNSHLCRNPYKNWSK